MQYEVERVMLQPSPGIAIRETHPMAELPSFFGSAFTELAAHAQAAGASITGTPFARYYSMPPGEIDVEAVFPVDADVAADGRVHPVRIAGGPAVQVLHVGPYEGLGAAYAAIEQWLREHAANPSEPPREAYLTGPDVEPSAYKTLVVQPVTDGG